MTSLFEACRRHAEHFGAVLRTANTRYLASENAPPDGLVLFDRERQNIEAAWRWISENAEDPRAMELCAEFPNFGPYILSMRLPARAWQSWLHSALQASGQCGAKRTQASHLGNLGVTHRRLGNVDQAIAAFEAQIALARELQLPQLEATAEGNIGLCHADRSDFRKAIEHQEINLRISREIGFRRGEAIALGNLGNAYADLGESERASRAYEDQLAIVRVIGDRQGEANALGNLGLVAIDVRDHVHAIEYFGQQLSLCREIGDRIGEGNALFSFGRAYDLAGDVARAIECTEEGIAILDETSHPLANEAREFFSKLVARQ
ncbi:tetratricopeptide repeat protein [Mesorhizobium waimense]|nr:tetratricopeptide repeat protein [Mesorhizobium waimense]